MRVEPSDTNSAIHAWDTTHVVFYDPTVASNKVLLWMAGTNRTPLKVPAELLNTTLAQGYRVIALSYLTVPAVSQVRVGKALDENIHGPKMFRRQGIYGDRARDRAMEAR